MYDVKPVTSIRNMDCGAVSLKMLLSYYGIDVDLDVLIEECKADYDGTSGADIMRVARLHGIENIKAYKMDANEVVRQDRPGICHWKYQHWIVCCGMDENGQVVICNPSRGIFRMPEGVFKTFYSGISIFNGEPEWVDDNSYRRKIEELEKLKDKLQAQMDALIEVADMVASNKYAEEDENG